jgi:hypothetical protein
LLTRSFEKKYSRSDQSAALNKREANEGQKATKELYEMALDATKRKQLIAALELYVYSIRER